MTNSRVKSDDVGPEAEVQSVYMFGAPANERLDVAAWCRQIWSHRYVAVSIATLVYLAAIAYLLIVAPSYRVEVVLLPNQSTANPNVPNGLSGLASLAGVRISGQQEIDRALATLRSRAFFEEFVQSENLLPILFQEQWNESEGRWIGEDPDEWPDIRDGVRKFVEQIRSVSEDPDTSLVTFSIEWTDPELAAQWAEMLVQRINESLRARDLQNSQRRLEYLRNQLETAQLVELRQGIARLIQQEVETITLARADAEYAYQVIDPPRVPDESTRPRLMVLIPLILFAGGVLGVVFASAYSQFLIFRAAGDP